MTDEENQTNVEASAEEVVQPSTSEQQDVQQADVQQVPNRTIDDQEHNWREARRKMQELERRAEEQQELIYRLQNQNPVEEDDLAKLADDDIVTAKQARRLAENMARQVADEAIREREASTVDERLKNRFSDFDAVVTRENIETLKSQDPELAMSLYALAHDPYAQAVAAYKLLKKQGIGDMAKNQPQKAKALENSRKPVSVQSVTKSSAIGEVHKFENGLTPELRKELWKEMQQAIKSA
jgi:hypothetical protein